MSAETLLALAARCEAAEGPERELDCDIACTLLGGEIVWKQGNYTMEMYPARRYASGVHVGGFGNAPVEPYTASLDAAMTLAPEGMLWVVTNCGTKGPKPNLSVCSALVGDADDCNTEGREAATPALALTAAALRARAGQEPQP